MNDEKADVAVKQPAIPVASHVEADSNERRWFQRLLLVLTLLVVVGAAFYYLKVPENVEYWGQAGDSMAPFTALLSAGTLLAALWSMALQRQETRESRQETRRTAVAQERAAEAQERLVDFELHKVRDAAAQLRDLATALSEATLSVIASEGLMTSGLTDGYKLTLRKKVVDVLQRLDVAPEALLSVTGTIDLVLRQRHLVRLLAAIREAKPKADDLDKELKPLISLDSIGTSRQVRELLQKHSMTDQAVREWLADLEHFERAKSFRRPELWNGTEEHYD